MIRSPKLDPMDKYAVLTTFSKKILFILETTPKKFTRWETHHVLIYHFSRTKKIVSIKQKQAKQRTTLEVVPDRISISYLP